MPEDRDIAGDHVSFFGPIAAHSGRPSYSWSLGCAQAKTAVYSREVTRAGGGRRGRSDADAVGGQELTYAAGDGGDTGSGLGVHAFDKRQVVSLGEPPDGSEPFGAEGRLGAAG